MATYTETINLDGNLSEEAKKAAAQVGVLSSGLASAEAALVKAAATGNVGAFRKATKDAEAFKAAIAAVNPALLAEVDAFKAAGVAADESAKAQAAAAEAAKKTADRWREAGEMALAGAKMVGAAVIAVGVAVGALILKGAELALSASDAKGDMILLFDTLGDGAVTGEQAVAMFDKLGEATGQTREKLAGTAQAFAAMGVTGVDQLEKLTLAAVSASAMAKGGGEAFEGMYKKIAAAQATGQALKIPLKGLGSLASMGLKVDDVAKQMGMSSADLAKQLEKGTVNATAFGDALSTALVEKGAGPVADAALDLGNMWAKAKESVGKFFEDIDVAPFLTEVKKLFGILDSGSATGQALKLGVGGFFKEFFAVATKAVPLVKSFFTSLIIYGLQAYLAIRPIVAAIKEFAASEEGAAAIHGLGLALRYMAVAAGVVVVAIGLLVAAIGATIGWFATAGAAVAGFAAYTLGMLGEWASDAADMATSFVQGLVDGIAAGGALVAAAVSKLAAQAKAAFVGALEIGSPSKVMMGYGVNMGEGAAMGVDASADQVAGSVEGMAATAVSAADGAPGPAGPSSGGGGVHVTIEPGAIVIQGGDAASLSELTEQAVAMIFERIALAQGLA